MLYCGLGCVFVFRSTKSRTRSPAPPYPDDPLSGLSEQPRRSGPAPNEPENKPRPPAGSRAAQTRGPILAAGRPRRTNPTAPTTPRDPADRPGRTNPRSGVIGPRRTNPRTRLGPTSTPAPNEPETSTPSRPPRTRSVRTSEPDHPHRKPFIPSPRRPANTADLTSPPGSPARETMNKIVGCMPPLA
jgi:hypothetical protein